MVRDMGFTFTVYLVLAPGGRRTNPHPHGTFKPLSTFPVRIGCDNKLNRLLTGQ